MRHIAKRIVERLHAAGFEAFWVGGCVRDVLLGREPKDYDIATNARPEQTERVFAKTIPVGKQFGVLLVVEEDHEFQIATFRAETDYQDGRRPGNVRFSDAREDAIRRDFTINGLFYDPVASKLHDWVGGEADLRHRIIRTIGSPDDRFAEDYLRLLRAIRFAAQLNFSIEEQTFAAVQRHADKVRLVSAERVREELVRLFMPPHAARGLKLLHESGVMSVVLPELVLTLTCDQSPDHHPEGTVFNHICLMLDQLPQPLSHEALPWAVLMHDIAKPQTASRGSDGVIHFYTHERIGAQMATSILQRLRFPRRQADEIVSAVRHHMQFKDAPQMRKATLRRMLMRPSFAMELELHRLDCLGSHRRLEIYDFLRRQQRELAAQPHLHPPLLSGHDLLARGIRPGPEIGAILSEVRDKQLADELRTREDALIWVCQRLTQCDAGRRKQ